MKVRITKCYFVEVLDKEGNVLDYQYVFDSRAEAEEQGRQMKEYIKIREKEERGITKCLINPQQ